MGINIQMYTWWQFVKWMLIRMRIALKCVLQTQNIQNYNKTACAAVAIAAADAVVC